jgi:Zn-finger nucleic acid-binding protein
MTPVKAGAVAVDVCKGGCGGMWFDQLELKRLDEPLESAGQILLDIEVDPGVSVDRSERRQCPKCDDITLMRFFYSPRQQVEVDHCAGCGGHWLDLGELRGVRSLYPSDAEREAHLEQIIQEMWGDELAAAEKRAEEAAGKKSIVRKMFEFIVPTADF